MGGRFHRNTQELEFVLNNLEMLEKNGKCVCILPMQCALSQKGKTFELKKKLLENHTLEAVTCSPFFVPFHEGNLMLFEQ